MPPIIDQTRPDQTRPDKTRPDKTRPDQTRPDKTSLLSQIPSVAVIMSTYNGEKYLNEQIDSILAQKDVHVELFIRDDGSSDRTREIISDYVNRYNNIHAEFGENLGLRLSFMRTLASAPNFDYYALSDQDDYWFEEKLITAVKAISKEQPSIPVIWESNAYVTDEKLNILIKTTREKRLGTICSLAIRTAGCGCAMVMNAKAREISRHKYSKEILTAYEGFDTSMVLVAVAEGGKFIVEKEALMKYRQHGHNVSGTPSSLKKRIKFEYRRFKKRRGGESKYAKVLLKYFNDEMTDNAKRALTLVADSKDNWLYRMIIFFSPKFRTGDIRLTLIEKLRALLGWI